MKTTVQTVAWVCVCSVIAVIGFARFAGLERSPPGMYCDEAIFAAHAIYLSETGHDIYGTVPMFVPSGGGGTISPLNLYPKALWVKIFGCTLTSIRAYPGLLGTLTLVGLYLLAQRLMDRRAAAFTLLAGSLSPWIFHFSRSTIDDYLLYVGGLVWGIYFFVRSTRARDAALAAAAFSVAAYGYFSARAVLPLMFPALLWLRARAQPEWRRGLALFVATGTVLCLPIVWYTANGILLVRGADVSIFSAHHRAAAGLGSNWAVFGEFCHNVLRHFSPKYLFVSGDSNLRHSTQFCGQLTWLDVFALLVGLAAAIYAVRQERRLRVDPVFAVCLLGIIVGTFPAALSWEGLPHAARSCGTWPFVALMTGYLLWTADRRWPAVLPAAATIAVVFAAGFLWHYFTVYPVAARPWYAADVADAAREAKKTGDWSHFDEIGRFHEAQEGWDPGALAYYRIAYGGKTAVEAFEIPPWMLREISATAMLVNMGRVCLRGGDSDSAVADYQQALARNPNLLPAQIGLGEAFLAAGRIPQAIGQLEQVVRAHPELIEPQVNYCNALVQAGAIDQALGRLRGLDSILATSPEALAARCQLAATFASVGRNAECVRVSEQILQVRPHQPEAHILLAIGWLRQGRPAEANAQFQQWRQYSGREGLELDTADLLRLEDRMRALRLTN